ncbi:hypothetical protein SAY87_007436 [Trapa incisa]|uniref:Membrane-associated kinase regulator 4 n=1 Tax=Trapa incisa TaxID=236973 RepID=A0AAN7KIL4_9MYRT|nr:hypothetical protein SAY87_007436 [Trapa incisa]
MEPMSNAFEDDDFIDIEISSSCFFTDNKSISQQSRDFEFPMGSAPQGRADTELIPADELFYKGKILPLLLPPRLQMVQRLQSAPSMPARFHQDGIFVFEDEDKETYALPDDVLMMPLTPSSTNTSTPSMGSCSVSPSVSSRVSCELTLEEDEDDDCFFEWSNELRDFIHLSKKKQLLNDDDKCCSTSSASLMSHAIWSKRLKQIKKSVLCQKLKASRAYLRAFFSKSKGVSGGSCYDDNNLLSSITKRISRELAETGAFSNHRKSFSAAIRRHCKAATNKHSSSSSCSSSRSSSLLSMQKSGVPYEFQLLKRMSSSYSELESSINGAIAHCKKTHKLLNPQNITAATSSEIASY